MNPLLMTPAVDVNVYVFRTLFDEYTRLPLTIVHHQQAALFFQKLGVSIIMQDVRASLNFRKGMHLQQAITDRHFERNSPSARRLPRPRYMRAI